MGRGTHLTPSGLDFDEHSWYLGAGTSLRTGASIGWPRQLPIPPGVRTPCRAACWHALDASGAQPCPVHSSGWYPTAPHSLCLHWRAGWCAAELCSHRLHGEPLALLLPKRACRQLQSLMRGGAQPSLRCTAPAAIGSPSRPDAARCSAGAGAELACPAHGPEDALVTWAAQCGPASLPARPHASTAMLCALHRG